MADLLRVVRGEDPVSPEDAYEVFEVLAPLLLAAPGNADAVEAASRTIARMPVDSLLAVVLDWWFVAATGEAPPLAQAFHLPADQLSPALKEAMDAVVSLTDQGIRVPPGRWVRASRELRHRLDRLDDDLNLDTYGGSKLPKEREVWSFLLGELDPVVRALRNGQPTERVELDQRAYEKEMKRCNIEVNSRRWKEMVKRARSCVDRVNEAVEVQAVVEPWVRRFEPPALDALPAHVTAALGPLGTLLLDPVWAAGGPPPGLPGERPGQADAERPADAHLLRDVEKIAARLTGIAAEASHEPEVSWLASIARHWLAAAHAEVPALTEMNRRRDEVAARIERLRQSGVDTIAAEVHLLDHQVAEAERLVDQVEEQRKQRRRGEALAKTLERLRGEAWDDVARPERWTERLDEAAALLARGDHATAERTIQALDREHRASRRSARIAELEKLRTELDRLDAPASLLVEIDEHLADLRDHPGHAVDVGLLNRTSENLDSLEAQRRREVEESIARAHEALEVDRDLIPPDALAGLELRLGEVETEFQGGELVAAADLVAGLLSEIQSQRVHRWTTAEGEPALVEHIVRYCTQQLHFDEADVRRLYVAAKTKPFVILAGLTGSGKSSIARLFAEALGADARNGRFRRVAVRPDWIDQSEVLGSINPLSNRFEPGWLADVARQCARNLDQLHVVLLDEMNLAPVEQYLAEFLSALEESRSGADGTMLPLYSSGASPENAKDWPAALPFPPNLIVFGTVNVDETTRVLSERVLDRANVLQLSVAISDAHHRPAGRPVQPWAVPFREWDAICIRQPFDGHHEFLVEAGDILHSMGIGLGQRSHIELERFVANADGVLDPELSLDLGVLQRIVPKIRGFKRDLHTGLGELHELLVSVGCQRSAQVTGRWIDDDVPDDEFLDGTDARIGLLR